MTSAGVLQIGIYFALILICAKPLGAFMARVFEGERTFLHPVLRWLEVLTYKAAGVREDVEQRWTQYAASLLSFSIFGFILVYLLQRLQGLLPFNPQHFGAGNVSPDLAFNTAISFVTNTNWQSYSGESTLSYFVQMAALTVQNFASAAAGIAIAIALIRGFTRQEKRTIGNFWVDVTRATVYVLLPLCLVGALLYCSQGVVQNLHPYTTVTTVEGSKQVIAQGPVASQEVIKQLGTNGGGFFNANSAHPFENPAPLSNLLAMVLIFIIPGALTYTFGKMVGDTRQGWAIFAAFSVMFLIGVFVAYHYEQAGNPMLTNLGLQNEATAGQPGGNMEGKEVRFGIANSALFATVTTDASCGAINSWHDSFTPLGGAVPLINIQLGEVIFGGVGSGLYGILAFAIIAMFVAGLMVGRTPEYLGKKLEAREVKMTILALLSLPLSILGWTALATVLPAGLAGIANTGPHGFTEILYAFTSATGNNGSAFAGISANTLYYNTTLAVAMLMGRFIFVIPLLAVAGSLAQKKLIAPSAGTFPTHSPQFVGLLVGVILIMGGLTYFPAVSLGPAVEQVAMNQGKLFPAP